MIIEAWILMDKTLLDSLWSSAKGNNPPESLKLLTHGVRGFWKDSGTDEVVNVIGTEEDITAFEILYGADIAAIYAWVQGPGVDNLDVFPTVPSGVLSLMLDHGVGNPATFENPNWGHVFLGQEERIFAGGFSNGFSEGFL